LWATFFAVLIFLPTILLREILLYVEDPTTRSREAAWLSVLGLFVASFCQCVGDGQSLWIGRRISLRIRAVIVGEVYSKALRRRDVALKGGDSLQDPADMKHSNTQEKKDKNVTALQTNHGAIINLMAVDAFKVSEISAYLHYLFASVPTELVISISLLYNLLGASALIGLVIMALIFPVQYLITRRFNFVQDQLMAATDKRVNRLNEVLQAIRIIKFFAWEDKFNAIVNESRRQELKWLRERLVLWASYGICWYGFPIIVTLSTFTSYTQWFGHDLTASTAFTALSLFSVLRKPIDQLADMITNVIQSKVSLDRVDQFLNEEETEKYSTAAKRRKSQVFRPGMETAKFENATFTWASRTEIENENAKDSAAIARLAFQLRDISIEFPSDALTLIVGPTGSGKTSLLMALLGELTLLNGSVYLPCTSRDDILRDPELGLTETVAYCAQQAWLLNDTIKNNILFAAPFNKRRYDQVVHATALEKDLQILEGGDETEVGEKGITMSGGQKQRISLARALYSSARFVLLDDCLSAVDPHTAQWIYQHGIAGELMAGRTRILVTHNVSLTLPAAKHVVILDNGRIKAQGSPERVLQWKGFGEETESIRNSLNRSGGTTPMSSQPTSRVPSSTSLVNLTALAGSQVDGSRAVSKSLIAKKNADRKKAGRLVRDEEKASGSVDWRVYKMYIQSLGPWSYWVPVFIVIVLQQLSQVLQSYWVRAWAASYGTRKTDITFPRDLFSIGNQSPLWGQSFQYGLPQITVSDNSVGRNGMGDGIMGRDPMFYIVGYAAVGLLYVLVTFSRAMLVVNGSVRAGRTLFQKLLDSVTHAKLRFFDTTPIGRIMNRFSKDMETVDQETAWVMFCVLFDLTSVTTIIVLITVITPAFLIAGWRLLGYSFSSGSRI
jgi:ABC-type multidrug transport system fused ATPase/permease subunit